jgi:tetratricopeptide (TPR) repeat protein
LLGAARDAERLPSYKTAGNFYREGWEIAEAAAGDRRDAPEAFQRLALQCGLGLCRMAAIYGAADLRIAEPVTLRAIEIAREVGDLELCAGLLSLLGNALSASGRARFAESLRLAEEAVAMAERANPGKYPMLVARGTAWIYLLDGRFEVASEACAQALAACERAGWRENLADAYFAAAFMANHHAFHSEPFDKAAAAMQATYDLAVEARNRTVQTGTSGSLAWMRFEQARYEEAESLAERSLTLAQAIGNVGGTRTAASILVLARIALGKAPPSAAVELIEMDRTNPADFGLKGLLVAEALVALGETHRAEVLADLAYRYAGGRLRELWASLGLGYVKRALGPSGRKEAEEWAARAVALASEIGSRWGLAAASLASGELAAERGDPSAARAQLERAISVGREIDVHRIVARAEQALARLGNEEESPQRMLFAGGKRLQ